jgi:hypothetical protein
MCAVPAIRPLLRPHFPFAARQPERVASQAASSVRRPRSMWAGVI